MERKKIFKIMQNSSKNAYFITHVNNESYARVVAPILESINEIYVISFSRSKKNNDISLNPKVTLTFIEYPGNGFAEAIIFGTAELINDMKIKEKIWNYRSKKLEKSFPDGVFSDEFSVIKIIPYRIEWKENIEDERNILKI